MTCALCGKAMDGSHYGLYYRCDDYEPDYMDSSDHVANVCDECGKKHDKEDRTL